MKTIQIKGKDYVMVHERIKAFREKYPTGAIITEIISADENTVMMKSTVSIDGVIVATGHAQEDRNNKSSLVNALSYIENCETSAVGRALAMLGIGIDAGIASAEEMQKEEKKAGNSFNRTRVDITFAKNAADLTELETIWKSNSQIWHVPAFKTAVSTRKTELSTTSNKLI